MISYADIYDWEIKLVCGDRKDEIDFWLDTAGRYGKTILELGAGSGMITLPLIKAGYDVTAVDISQSMLDILKRKVDNLEKRGDVHLHLGSMEEISYRKEFDLCCVPYSSFQFLLEPSRQLNCLKNISYSLKSNGVLCLDLDNDLISKPINQSSALLYSEFYRELSVQITMYTSWKTDCVKWIRHWKDTYYLSFMNAENMMFENDISLKAIKLEEIRNLLKLAGFEIIGTYGNYRRSLYDTESERLIVIAALQ